MGPRLIIVSDFHAGLWAKGSKPCNDVNTRFHHERMVLRQIFDFALEVQGSIIFDGDIFDTRKTVDCRVTNMVYHEIINGALKLANINNGEATKNVYLLAGNHDQVDNSRRPDNSLGIFKNIVPNLYVIDKPSWYNLKSGKTKDVLFFLPYSEDKKWLQGYLDDWAKVNRPVIQNEPNTNPILFAHLGVAGAKMGAHLVRLSGEFSLKDLHPSAFRWIILGHYHHRQYLNKSHTAFYVGNTIPLRYEDSFQKKGIWYLDTETKESKFIPIKSPMFYEMNLDKYYPVYKKNSHDDDPQATFREKMCKLNKTNFIRIESTNKVSLDWYSKHGFDTVYRPSQTYTPRLNIKPTSTSKQIVSKFIDKYDKDPKLKKVALHELLKAHQSIKSSGK